MQRSSVLPFLLVSGALSGCATNSLRIDRTESMSDAGRAAIEATLKMADDAARANEDAIIEIAVYDPNCSLPQPSIVIGAKKGLCPGDTGAKSIPYFRATKRDLLPTLAVIGGISSYLDRIDEIVAREPADIAGSLSAARQDLEAVQAIIGVKNTLPKLSADQNAAVKSALDLIAVLAAEAAAVNSLRDLERQRDPQLFNDAIANLDTLNEAWVKIFRESMKSQFSVVNEAYRTTPPADPQQRRALVARQMEINGFAESAPELQQALKTLTKTFKQAHEDYLALLPANSKAKLTPAERKKKASLIKARVRAALHSVAALVTSF
jgi:hypothetical protein